MMSLSFVELGFHLDMNERLSIISISVDRTLHIAIENVYGGSSVIFWSQMVPLELLEAIRCVTRMGGDGEI